MGMVVCRSACFVAALERKKAVTGIVGIRVSS